MENPWEGEVCLTLDGEAHCLKLTLGALAALEAELETVSLAELVERFETGRFTVAELVMLLHAGLRGGGWRGSREALLARTVQGGALEAARVGALLLARAFAFAAEAQT
jgi:hypothetical protein